MIPAPPSPPSQSVRECSRSMVFGEICSRKQMPHCALGNCVFSMKSEERMVKEEQGQESIGGGAGARPSHPLSGTQRSTRQPAWIHTAQEAKCQPSRQGSPGPWGAAGLSCSASLLLLLCRLGRSFSLGWPFLHSGGVRTRFRQVCREMEKEASWACFGI